jgi:hypothetical protein
MAFASAPVRMIWNASSQPPTASTMSLMTPIRSFSTGQVAATTSRSASMPPVMNASISSWLSEIVFDSSSKASPR